jgi:hypothetical protein
MTETTQTDAKRTPRKRVTAKPVPAVKPEPEVVEPVTLDIDNEEPAVVESVSHNETPLTPDTLEPSSAAPDVEDIPF